ncbi:hypothetical protein WCLP8_4940017 [uncultured Gammaproteobacteria bacterium]
MMVFGRKLRHNVNGWYDLVRIDSARAPPYGLVCASLAWLAGRLAGSLAVARRILLVEEHANEGSCHRQASG